MVKRRAVVLGCEECVLQHLALLWPLVRTSGFDKTLARVAVGPWENELRVLREAAVPHVLKRSRRARGVIQGNPAGDQLSALARVKV